MSCNVRRLGLYLIALYFGHCAMQLSHALAAEPQRVVLRLAGDADRALLPRLLGQLSDVEAQLIASETSPLEAALPERVEVARALATLHHADVVMWCADAGEDGWVVQIALPRVGRILTRRFAEARQAGFTSDELETAAVFVRSAVSMLGHGVELGVPLDGVLSEDVEAPPKASLPAETPAPRALSEEKIEATSSHSAELVAEKVEPTNAADEISAPVSQLPSARIAARRDEGIDRSAADQTRSPSVVRARFSLGAQLALDGQSLSGQRGICARAGMSVGNWAVYAYGVYSFASEIEDPYFALRVARHAVGAAIERQFPLDNGFRLDLALHAGALLLYRSSWAVSSSVVSYPASLMSVLALGPELALSWLPSRYGVSLRFGLDWLANVPRFEAVASAAAPRSSHALWAIEPRVALAWETVLP